MIFEMLLTIAQILSVIVVIGAIGIILFHDPSGGDQGGH